MATSTKRKGGHYAPHSRCKGNAMRAIADRHAPFIVAEAKAVTGGGRRTTLLLAGGSMEDAVRSAQAEATREDKGVGSLRTKLSEAERQLAVNLEAARRGAIPWV